MTPRSDSPGATAALTPPGRRGARTIGAAGLASAAAAGVSSSTMPAAAPGSATITANGFAGRFLRSRSSATTSPSSARQARWNPPMPFTATTAPASSAAAAAPMGSLTCSPPGACQDSRGPQSPQAMV